MLEPDEQAFLFITLQNDGGDAEQVTASLRSSEWQITPVQATCEFASIPGLSHYDRRCVENTKNPFVITIHPCSLPVRVPVQILVDDQNGTQWNFQLFIPVNPSILLVDDDDGKINDEEYYNESLDSLGLTAFHWDRASAGAPLQILNKFQTTIWFCEQTGSVVPTVDSLDRALLQDYLEHGGNLFISGQDIGWDLCESPGSNYINQYDLSGGRSRDFYEHCLHAHYLADVSSYSRVIGETGNEIGDGLFFDVREPGRREQYPSEITPLNGAVSLFSYPNDHCAAVGFASLYRLIYFAFGGLEVVSDVHVRTILLHRILDWLTRISVEHNPDTDVMLHKDGFNVKTHILCFDSSIKNVELYWTDQFDNPYLKVPMVLEANNVYDGFIPFEDYCHIHYAIRAEFDNGIIAPIHFYSYSVQPDSTPVIIENLTASGTFFNKDSINVAVKISGAATIDSDDVKVHYFHGHSASDSACMKWNRAERLFEARVPGPFCYGDTVVYSFSAHHAGCSSMSVRTEPDTCVVGLEDFESGLFFWHTGSTQWDVDSVNAFSGHYCIRAIPAKFEVENDTASVFFTPRIDLSRSRSATLSFWSRHDLQDTDDFGIIQICADSSWSLIGPLFTGVADKWYKVEIPLDNYCGVSAIQLAFSFISTAKAGNGSEEWEIDDVRVKECLSVKVSDKHNDRMNQEAYGMDIYPNPFNPSITIAWHLDKRSQVRLCIMNMLGQHVATLYDASLDAGFHRRQWNGVDKKGEPVAAGIYFLYLQIDGKNIMKKITLIR
jgi:hypothetical protein